MSLNIWVSNADTLITITEKGERKIAGQKGNYKNKENKTILFPTAILVVKKDFISM